MYNIIVMGNDSKKQNIRKYIRYYILDNINKDEVIIPSEQVLMRMFNVSRGTVRDSLKKFVYTGLITPVQGKGYIANKKSFNLILLTAFVS